MKKISIFLTTIALTVGIIGLATTASVSAQDFTTGSKQVDPCVLSPGSGVCHYKNTRSSSSTIIKNIVNILLYIVGASAVIMIIISGLKYITSAGNPSGVASAKSTLLYSVVGLAVAMVAYVIVNWVISSVSG